MTISLDSLDFTAVEQRLGAAYAPTGAAEAHGLLCGLLCAHGADGRRLWVTELFDQDEMKEALPQGGGDLLDRLFSATLAALQDEELGFTLLLPDDEQPLPARAQALADWCQGFLYAIGLMGVAAEKRLSGQGREALRDFTEITRMDIASVDEVGEAEDALVELVEFVRVAVMLIYGDLAQEREEA